MGLTLSLRATKKRSGRKLIVLKTDRATREPELLSTNHFHTAMLAILTYDLDQPLQVIIAVHELLALKPPIILGIASRLARRPG